MPSSPSISLAAGCEPSGTASLCRCCLCGWSSPSSRSAWYSRRPRPFRNSTGQPSVCSSPQWSWAGCSTVIADASKYIPKTRSNGSKRWRTRPARRQRRWKNSGANGGIGSAGDDLKKRFSPKDSRRSFNTSKPPAPPSRPSMRPANGSKRSKLTLPKRARESAICLPNAVERLPRPSRTCKRST